MATSRHEFQYEGHQFEFELVANLYPAEYTWHANVWCSGQGIGQIHGHADKWTVTPVNWEEGFLKAMAVFDVENKVRNRVGIDW